ncbi:MAG: rod shape-determining protein MreC [Bacteroidales bacterium]|nr:rod shape-determining protein MreC [Bacteroidales bacterium]
MRNLIIFLWKHQFFVIFIILEVLAFSMLINTYSYQRTLSFNAANDVTGDILDANNNISSYFFLKAENNKLLEENARLRDKLKSSYLNPDTAKVRRDSVYIYIPATVIRNTVNRYNNFMVLNVGKNKGIKKEMGVISDQGIAGIVVGVSDNYSIAMSLLNENAKISARIKKNNQLVNVIWNSDNYDLGKVVDIPAHFNLNEGDTIVTSGNSFIFPAGLVVGTIMAYHKSENEGLSTASLKYGTPFGQLHYVYILKNLMKKEQLQLIKEAAQ